jgi:hypothetical protein
MTTLKRISLFACSLACASLLTTALRAASAGADAFLDRWALTLPTAAGWLEVKRAGSGYEAALLWGGGSVEPQTSATIVDGVLTVTKVRNLPAGKKGKEGKEGEASPRQVTDTLTARIEDGALKGTRKLARANGTFDDVAFSGKRIPALPPRPNLARVKFGEAISLFNGRDLTGWKMKEANGTSAWTVADGTLANQPPAHVEGQPRVRTANLRTEREFEDFNLKLEVNVPAGNNSGVYLRGIYEIQIFDSYGKPLDSHNMGALYSRITPSVAAEKPPGEWQSLDMTLVDRHLTVVLNGKTIIDNQPVLGCTGGAMWSDESKPGPLYLQGDHGAVSYRNIVLRPVVK